MDKLKVRTKQDTIYKLIMNTYTSLGIEYCRVNSIKCDTSIEVTLYKLDNFYICSNCLKYVNSQTNKPSDRLRKLIETVENILSLGSTLENGYDIDKGLHYPEIAYNYIFSKESNKLYDELEEYTMFPDYYDPDTTYLADTLAKLKQLKKVYETLLLQGN